jgi:FKBP-type peptidyl-prolyl cis-trans isomerase SlyD
MVVTIDYTLTDDDGNVVDTSQGNEPMAYLHGANNIIPGLETALEGKKLGDEFSVTVNPEEGYGERDDSRQQVVPREMFGEEEIQVGAQFHAASPDGNHIVVTVMNVDGDNITVDGNHPLAGQTLNFDVKVVDIRDATQEELDHGHVHGPEGHQH